MTHILYISVRDQFRTCNGNYSLEEKTLFIPLRCMDYERGCIYSIIRSVLRIPVGTVLRKNPGKNKCFTLVCFYVSILYLYLCIN